MSAIRSKFFGKYFLIYRFKKNFTQYSKGHIPLRDAFFAPEIIVSDGIDPILRGLFLSTMKKPLPEQIVNQELTDKVFHKAHDVRYRKSLRKL